MHDVAIVSNKSAFAVGGHGVIRETVDTGNTWQYLISNSTNDLYGCAFANEQTGVAVGDSGTILCTNNGGQDWNSSEIAMHAALRRVASNGHIFITVGEGGIILRTTNDGAQWTSVQNPLNVDLHDVAFVDSQTIITIGQFGKMEISNDTGKTWTEIVSGAQHTLNTIFLFTNKNWDIAGDSGEFILTSDAGVHWVRQPFDTLYDFYSFAFSDTNNGEASGIYNGASPMANELYTTDGGVSWNYSPVSSSLLYKINWSNKLFKITTTDNGGISSVSIDSSDRQREHDVSGGNTYYSCLTCTSNHNCVALGIRTAYESAGQPGNIIFADKTSDGGRTWSFQQISPFVLQHGHQYSNIVTAVCAIDSLNLTAVGDSGLILRTSNGGATWLKQQSGTANVLYDVSFIDEQNGIAGGTFNASLNTTNGGQTWNKIKVTSDTLGEFDHVEYLSKDRFFFFDMMYTDTNSYYTIDYTTNSGNSFTKYSFVFPGIQAGVINSFYFIDSTHGWAVGARPTGGNTGGGLPLQNDVIFKTTDGGMSWVVALDKETNTAEGLRSIAFADPQNGIAVGYNAQILRTTDGGNTWLPQISPIANLTSAAIQSVDFPVSAFAIAVTWFHGVMVYQDSLASYVPERKLEIPAGGDIVSYPNPFHSSITIASEALPESDERISVVDMLGKEIAVLKRTGDGISSPEIEWTPDANVPSGTYFIKVVSSGNEIMKPVIYMR